MSPLQIYKHMENLSLNGAVFANSHFCGNIVSPLFNITVTGGGVVSTALHTNGNIYIYPIPLPSEDSNYINALKEYSPFGGVEPRYIMDSPIVYPNRAGLNVRFYFKSYPVMGVVMVMCKNRDCIDAGLDLKVNGVKMTVDTETGIYSSPTINRRIVSFEASIPEGFTVKDWTTSSPENNPYVYQTGGNAITFTQPDLTILDNKMLILNII